LSKRTYPNEHRSGWQLIGVGQQIYGTSTARVSRDCDGSCCYFDYI